MSARRQAAAALLLALGFLGLAHNLIETTAGEPPRRDGVPRGLRTVTAFACVSVVALLALTVASFWLPGSTLVDSLLGAAR